jgi:hypothetical protein
MALLRGRSLPGFLSRGGRSLPGGDPCRGSFRPRWATTPAGGRSLPGDPLPGFLSTTVATLPRITHRSPAGVPFDQIRSPAGVPFDQVVRESSGCPPAGVPLDQGGDDSGDVARGVRASTIRCHFCALSHHSASSRPTDGGHEAGRSPQRLVLKCTRALSQTTPVALVGRIPFMMYDLRVPIRGPTFVIRPLVATSTSTDVALRYVLDTNVLSEPMRPVRDPEVIKRITQAHDTIATTSPVWHEIEIGRLRLPAGKRRRASSPTSPAAILAVLWWHMVRAASVWTWDVGEREIDLDTRPEALVPVLETILEGGLWNQFRKFPPDTLARLLPYLNVPSNTRRLIELWIDEAPARPKTRR